MKIIKNFADKAQYLYIFGKYMTVGTSMKKISSLALLVRQLRRGVIFTPPPYDRRIYDRPYEIGLNKSTDLEMISSHQNH